MNQETQWNDLFTIQNKFINTIGDDNRLKYADTDSAYISITLPFNKKEDNRKTVDYAQKITRKMNDVYLNALNYYVGNFGNMDTDYNTMDFKSEVVAYRGFFLKKKFYSLGIIWDEGEFFDKLKRKITGGQIAKADITHITENIITEIYDILVMNQDEVELRSMYKKIFVDLKNKSSIRLRNSIKSYNFKDFGIPKKWGLKKGKTITPQVVGAKLYNTIVTDIFRPGDSFLKIQIKVNLGKFKKYIKDKPNMNSDSNYFLCDKDVTSKMNIISIPTDLTSDEHSELKKIFEESGITLDYDTIMNFNIGLKMAPFELLFPDRYKI